MNFYKVQPHAAPGPMVQPRLSRQPSVPDWQAGDEITASLTERSGGAATLTTEDGYTFTADSKAIQGEVGDKLQFKVIKNGGHLSLKQILNHNNEAARPRGDAKPADEIRLVGKTLDTIGEEDQRRLEESQAQQEKASEVIARIQRAQHFMQGNTGRSAVVAIVESGISLTKVGFALFNRVLHEAEKAPAENLPEEDLRLLAESHSFRRPADADAIIRSLHANGLPVNGQNINTLERAAESVSATLDDRAVERLIGGESNITLNDIYKSRYAAPERETPSAHEAPPLEGLSGEIQKFFTRSGIADTEANREAAHFLIAKGLPLDGDNVAKTVFLRKLTDHISKDALFMEAAKAISHDTSAGDIPLSRVIAVDDQPLRLAETQLRFSVQAAARLHGRRLAVDTEPLRETVKDLTERANELYARFLRYAGADDGPESVSRMAGLYDTLSDIQPLTVNVHAGIMRASISFTINAIHGEVQAARARAGYEQFATVPNPRYGDSFAAVRTQFSPLLESMDITPTAENMKAAFILSKNDMDVDWENITRVKEIDAKVTAVSQRLHPMIAAKMIGEGLSPLEMHADQLLEYIRQYQQEYGEDGGEKVARYIMEMDDDKSIDADTRKRMVAVYRMLHVIQKDGAAALGLAARQNEPVTLGGLMELSKFFEQNKRKHSGVDYSIDDAFGHLERLSRPAESIRQLLERPRAAERPITQTDLSADAFIDIAQPAHLRALLNNEANGRDIALEDAPYQGLTETMPDDAAVMRQMQAFMAASPAHIAFMHNKNIPATLGGLRALAKITRNPGALAESLENLDGDAAEDIREALPDSRLTPLREGVLPERLYAEILSRLDSAGGQTETREGAEAVEAAKQLAGLQYRLNEEGNYQLPVKINGRVTQLNIFVLNGKTLLTDGARVLVSLDTRTMGTVQAAFTLNQNKADVTVLAGSPGAYEKLSAGRGVLEAFFHEAGFNEADINYKIQNSAVPDARRTQEQKPNTGRVLGEYEFMV